MELTPEQIAKIFSLYLGCKVFDNYDNDYRYLFAVSLRGCTVSSKIQCTRNYDEVKLILRTIEQLTDAEAVEVAKMYFKDQDVEVNDGKHIVTKYILKNYQDGLSFSEAIFLFQYLISIGIAVPLFVSPGHELNGKTAIEIGLGIQQQS